MHRRARLDSTSAIWLEPASDSDFDRLFELRMQAMKESLERIGRYDLERGRLRFRAGFRPAFTRLILHQQEGLIGCVGLGPRDDCLWLEHFYIRPSFSGIGIGTTVMTALLAEADGSGLPVRLDVVRESAAKQFYERFGFAETHRDEVDIFMERPALSR